MFVIDPKGTLIYNGAIDDKPTTDRADVTGATNYVSAALTEAMSGKPVARSTSRPYGCSVKSRQRQLNDAGARGPDCVIEQVHAAKLASLVSLDGDLLESAVCPDNPLNRRHQRIVGWDSRARWQPLVRRVQCPARQAARSIFHCHARFSGRSG